MRIKSSSKIRKLTRAGQTGSTSVVIPAEINRALGWRQKQRVLVKKISRAIIIRDAMTKHKKIKHKIMNQYTFLTEKSRVSII